MTSQIKTVRVAVLMLFWGLQLAFLLSCGKSGGYAPSPAPVTEPSALTITSPLLLTKISNTALTIAGGCQNDATVFLTGSDIQSVGCAASAFSFNIKKTTSGTYFFNLHQSNTAGSSAKVTVSWLYDISAPPSIIISSPLANPYTSGDSAISISGDCETGATVNIAGDHIASTTCTADSFIFTGIAKTVDGSYVFNLTQTDAATNVSAATSFTWIRDTTIPPTPTITNFSDNPRYTNTSPLTVSGGCGSPLNTLGHDVKISEAGADLATVACSATDTYSLNIAKAANGTYKLALYQTDTDPAISVSSANRDFTWVYDSVAPPAPAITNPSVSPVTSSGTLVISGSCETNATVNLTVDDIQSKVCSAGSYSFSISEAVDGTYNYSVTQTDLALNTSVAATQQWVKDSTALPIPTIDTPLINPFISNLVNLILSGQCQTGLTVQLSGVVAADVLEPAGSLTMLCVDSAYSYTITKPDGAYKLTINQTDGSKTSANVTRDWTKDTIEPETTISSLPLNPNYSIVASFVFSANEISTFECSLNAAAYSTCVSPLNLTNLTNASHTLNIRAIDLAKNIDSTPATYTWTQNAHKAVALYHFDAAAPMLDSSHYTGGASNTLTDNASANLDPAKFLEGRTMDTTTKFASVADTPSQQVLTSNLTLESQIKIIALPAANGDYAPIISKIKGTAASFEYGIRRKTAKAYQIYFRGSLDGSTYTEKRSTTLTDVEILNGFNHIAVTWNLGSVKFFFNGAAKGTATIGTAGSSKLAISAAPLRVSQGETGTTTFTLNGHVDEARISQLVRWTSTFTPPAAAYTAD